MELKVHIDNTIRIVCGLTKETTAQDVIIALAHSLKQTGRFYLIEKTAATSMTKARPRPPRIMAPHERPIEIIADYGRFFRAESVEFHLVRSQILSRDPGATPEDMAKELMELINSISERSSAAAAAAAARTTTTTTTTLVAGASSSGVESSFTDISEREFSSLVGPRANAASSSDTSVCADSSGGGGSRRGPSDTQNLSLYDDFFVSYANPCSVGSVSEVKNDGGAKVDTLYEDYDLKLDEDDDDDGGQEEDYSDAGAGFGDFNSTLQHEHQHDSVLRNNSGDCKAGGVGGSGKAFVEYGEFKLDNLLHDICKQQLMLEEQSIRLDELLGKIERYEIANIHITQESENLRYQIVNLERKSAQNAEKLAELEREANESGLKRELELHQFLAAQRDFYEKRLDDCSSQLDERLRALARLQTEYAELVTAAHQQENSIIECSNLTDEAAGGETDDTMLSLKESLVHEFGESVKRFELDQARLEFLEVSSLNLDKRIKEQLEIIEELERQLRLEETEVALVLEPERLPRRRATGKRLLFNDTSDKVPATMTTPRPAIVAVGLNQQQVTMDADVDGAEYEEIIIEPQVVADSPQPLVLPSAKTLDSVMSSSSSRSPPPPTILNSYDEFCDDQPALFSHAGSSSSVYRPCAFPTPAPTPSHQHQHERHVVYFDEQSSAESSCSFGSTSSYLSLNIVDSANRFSLIRHKLKQSGESTVKPTPAPPPPAAESVFSYQPAPRGQIKRGCSFAAAASRPRYLAADNFIHYF